MTSPDERHHPPSAQPQCPANYARDSHQLGAISRQDYLLPGCFDDANAGLLHPGLTEMNSASLAPTRNLVRLDHKLARQYSSPFLPDSVVRQWFNPDNTAINARAAANLAFTG